MDLELSHQGKEVDKTKPFLFIFFILIFFVIIDITSLDNNFITRKAILIILF